MHKMFNGSRVNLEEYELYAQLTVSMKQELEV